MSIARTYRYTDARLLELAAVMLDHLSEHEALLQQYDPQLSALGLEQVIADATAHGMDDFERGKVRSQTKRYYAAAQLCQKHLGHLRFYIKEAAEEETVAVAAGFLATYREKRKTKASFVLWISSFALQVRDCRTALEQVGAPAVLIDKFLAQADVLAAADAEQGMMKRKRTSSAADRIKAANTLYAALRRLERLAVIVHEDGHEEADLCTLFKLPSLRRKAKNTPAAQVAEQEEQTGAQVQEAPASRAASQEGQSGEAMVSYCAPVPVSASWPAEARQDAPVGYRRE